MAPPPKGETKPPPQEEENPIWKIIKNPISWLIAAGGVLTTGAITGNWLIGLLIGGGAVVAYAAIAGTGAKPPETSAGKGAQPTGAEGDGKRKDAGPEMDLGAGKGMRTAPEPIPHMPQPVAAEPTPERGFRIPANAPVAPTRATLKDGSLFSAVENILEYDAGDGKKRALRLLGTEDGRVFIPSAVQVSDEHGRFSDTAKTERDIRLSPDEGKALAMKMRDGAVDAKAHGDKLLSLGQLAMANVKARMGDRLFQTTRPPQIGEVQVIGGDAAAPDLNDPQRLKADDTRKLTKRLRLEKVREQKRSNTYLPDEITHTIYRTNWVYVTVPSPQQPGQQVGGYVRLELSQEKDEVHEQHKKEFVPRAIQLRTADGKSFITSAIPPGAIPLGLTALDVIKSPPIHSSRQGAIIGTPNPSTADLNGTNKQIFSGALAHMLKDPDAMNQLTSAPTLALAALKQKHVAGADSVTIQADPVGGAYRRFAFANKGTHYSTEEIPGTITHNGTESQVKFIIHAEERGTLFSAEEKRGGANDKDTRLEITRIAVTGHPSGNIAIKTDFRKPLSGGTAPAIQQTGNVSALAMTQDENGGQKQLETFLLAALKNYSHDTLPSFNELREKDDLLKAHAQAAPAIRAITAFGMVTSTVPSGGLDPHLLLPAAAKTAVDDKLTPPPR